MNWRLPCPPGRAEGKMQAGAGQAAKTGAAGRRRSNRDPVAGGDVGECGLLSVLFPQPWPLQRPWGRATGVVSLGSQYPRPSLPCPSMLRPQTSYLQPGFDTKNRVLCKINLIDGNFRASLCGESDSSQSPVGSNPQGAPSPAGMVRAPSGTGQTFLRSPLHGSPAAGTVTLPWKTRGVPTPPSVTPLGRRGRHRWEMSR